MNKTVKYGITYFNYPPWEQAKEVVLGFSTRCGGVSAGQFAELNLGYKGEDRAAAVSENRRRFLALWDKNVEDLVCGDQVHGTNVVAVNSKEAGSVIPHTDGLITGDPALVLGAFCADCLLVFLWERETPAIGLVHAGWRGTLGGIVHEAVETMQQLGAKPHRIKALLAPCIKPCCYEVGIDVIAGAAASPWGENGVFHASVKEGHALFDLQQTNYKILVASGIRPEHIALNSLCTRCESRLFYSYRRAGGKLTGSNMGIIFINER